MKTLHLKTLINQSWLKITNFKATFWLGTLFALIAYLIVSSVSVIFLILANYSIFWLILSGFCFLGGLFFLFLPVHIGVFRLSILHTRNEPIQAKSVYQYLDGLTIFKIGMIGIVSFFIILLLSAAPSILAQIIITFIVFWLNAITLLALMMISDKKNHIDEAVVFVFDALKTNWWQLLVLILIGYLVLIVGLLTLGIAFIWLAPWYTNLWGLTYNQLIENRDYSPSDVV